MTLLDHALFLLSVALACAVQNLTGFAFGLVLLGLAALTGVASLPALTHVVSVLVLVNAASLFWRARPRFAPGVMAPTLAGSLLGVLAGVALLQALSQHWLPLLQALLGVTIMVAAADLLVRPAPQAQLASPLRFGGFGLLSGLLGGLFSTAGPPLVYHFYRQPLPAQRIRDALVTVFAVNAALRLVLMAGSGQIDRQVLMLSAEALPLVWLITWAMAGRAPPLASATLRRLVCGLLGLVALSLMASALRRL
jgi:uncharacterized membrane protein YfcA